MTDMELVTQPAKRVRMKVEMCDKNLNLIDEIDGDMLSLSLNIDSASDIRRTITLSMHMDDMEYFENSFVTMWLNRAIKVKYGIWDIEEKRFKWFPLGTYLVTQNSYTYDASTQRLDLMVADLMASITEERGSQIGTEVTVEADATAQNAMTSTVTRFFPFTKCNVWDFEGKKIPYDLEFERGIYPYEIVKKIVELWPNCEHFFSPDGTYMARMIPTGEDDPVTLRADEVERLIISNGGVTRPRDIKNATEIWGKELDALYTSENCDGTSAAGTYTLFLDETFEVLEDGMTVAFTPDVNSVSGQKMQIQDTGRCPIYVQEGDLDYRPVKASEIHNGIQYVVKYTLDKYVLQGQSEIHAMCMEFNKAPSLEDVAKLQEDYACADIRVSVNRHSNYSVEKIGVQKSVLQGGEYADIYTTELALERAAYENWKTTRVQDTLQLTMLFVPWLDVNQIIEYRSIVTGEVNQYMVKSISASADGFWMTVNLIKFYPFYPWMREKRSWGFYKGKTWGFVKKWYWDEVLYVSK